MSVQDGRCPGYVGFRHANCKHGASSFDGTAIEGRFVLLNVPPEEAMPQSGFTKLVASYTQGFTVDHADLAWREARRFEVASRSLRMLGRVIECYYLFVVHCFSFSVH